MKRSAARKAIMTGVKAALAENDILTVIRIYARLSATPLETVIIEAVNGAIDDASKTEYTLAARFADLRGI